MEQTPEERERLLGLGKDGAVVCIDMSTAEGQDAIEDLCKLSDHVQIAVARDGPKAPDGYLLALYLFDQSKRVVVGIAPRQHIKHAIKLFYNQALTLGTSFVFGIIPADESIALMVAELPHVQGSA